MIFGGADRMRLFLSGRPAGESLASPALAPDRQFENKEQEAFLFRLYQSSPKANELPSYFSKIDGFVVKKIARLEGVKINTVWAQVRTLERSSPRTLSAS